MFARKLLIVSAMAGASLLLLTGCFSMPWSRTGNQGGGTIVTAASKLVNDNLGAITPDEVQLLTDVATQIGGVSTPAVTDEQAAAVVTFLSDNGITSFDTLEQTIRQAERDPTSLVISDEVLEVLQTLAGSADQYTDLQNVNVQGIQAVAEEIGINL